MIDAGPFSIRPPWLEAGNGIDLIVDPGHAFGSGSHPSTRLALALLAPLVTAGDRVLDLGTGSGILAIAAAKLGAEVVAIDIDPAAAPAVATNAARNGVADSITIEIADLGEPATIVSTLPADLTCFNVTIDIHEAVGPLLTDLVSGPMVVAGILSGEQETRCARAHQRSVTERSVEAEWAALRLDHGPSERAS